MPFHWSKQSILWFLNASTYTGFHHALAQVLLPYLEPDDTMCDIGCGLGRLDLELAPHVAQLTALDIDSQVVGILDRDAQSRNLSRLQVRCADAAHLTEHFDILLMSFFGKSGSGIQDYLRLCSKKLIRIVNVENSSSLYPERYRRTKKDTVSVIHKELAELELRFCLEIASIEFGQPLRSQQEAEQFILHHAPKAGKEEVLTFLQEHLTQTGREDFPFYLPNRKEIGIFIIDRRE